MSGFLVEPQKQGQQFPGFALKTGNSGLVIWVSKSPHQFLGLGLQTRVGAHQTPISCTNISSKCMK
jgi:hypothetical protein